MSTLDDVIATLEKLRDEMGGKTMFLMGNAGNRSIEEADYYDIAGIFRTRETNDAVIMYQVPSSMSLLKRHDVKKAGQRRVRMVRAKY